MTHVVTNKRAWRFSTLLRYGLAVLLLLPSLGKAQFIEGTLCVAEPTDMAITYGNLVNCKIDPVGDLDFFRFFGAPGELIRVQIADQGGFGTPIFEVFDPAGAPVTSCSNLGFSGSFGFSTGTTEDCQLTVAGTHTIRISETNSNSTVDYGLALERIAPLSPAARSIVSTQTIADQINAVGDIDAYFFNANAGDLYFVQMARQSGGSAAFEVFSPDGNLLCADSGFSQVSANCPLIQTGAHTILVSEESNDGTVQYSLSLQCVSGNCPPPLPPPPVPPPPPPPEAGPATPQIPIPCTGSRCRLLVTCNLAPQSGTPCSNRIDLIALVPRSALRLSDDGSTRAPRRIRFAVGTSTIQAGATANVRLRVTTTGKRVRRIVKRRLIDGVLEIRNAPGALISSTSVRIRRR